MNEIKPLLSEIQFYIVFFTTLAGFFAFAMKGMRKVIREESEKMNEENKKRLIQIEQRMDEDRKRAGYFFRLRLEGNYYEIMSKDSITAKEKSDFIEMYDMYKAGGFNSVADTMRSDVANKKVINKTSIYVNKEQKQ